MENTHSPISLIPTPLAALKSEISDDVVAKLIPHIQSLFSTIAPKSQDQFLSRKEAASVLGICLATLNNWQKEGIVQGYRVGSRVRYKRSELEGALSQIKSVRNVA